ncbi:MAG: response regulator [Bdellovibrionaceae bacterium]|jgi:CheY-like chemotaxis protein|nr:response regulator [Pseudobdellovibrionaceae bacterium]
MFPKNTKILVVDDSAHIRRMVVDCLHQMGFRSYKEAEDANEAFGLLKEASDTPEPFTLILSDLNMPGPSGLDFLKQVRSLENFKHLPFLLVTTESEKASVIEAAMSGVSSYIVKPFDVGTLSKKMIEAWKKHNPE